MEINEMISEGKIVLGIEFGSTRIKAVLTDLQGNPIEFGDHTWENDYVDGIWTYSEEAIWCGLQNAYADLKKNVKNKYGVAIKSFAAIGFSAMMHGYVALNDKDELLVPFRTWRNTITEEAADKLTDAFDFNIPQRWSIAHLYQAILNGEEHVKDISFLTTLAGLVHYKLTGSKVLGVGDASGMFPIDSEKLDYDSKMLSIFDGLVADKNFPWTLKGILPKVLNAGEDAGKLTKEGALLLDPAGDLEEGILLCPPEGDAGTGMVATNSVAPETGNISAGTSVFAMVVLKKALSKLHREIDMVTTPSGAPVAMVHCNNCTSEINAWADLFDQFAKLMGVDLDKGDLFTKLYGCALDGDKDCGGLIYYNYLSGEPVTGFMNGSPLFVRNANDNFTIQNFMRMHLYSALASLRIGMNILTLEEKVTIKKMFGHGGFFKTPVAGQTVCSAAINAPICLLTTAGEGGAWGISVLALYAAKKSLYPTLEEFLDKEIFAKAKATELMADKADIDGFEKFMDKYVPGLEIEKKATEILIK
ncbi:MAG: ATPase [Clostridiales bacterium]|nr:ATPase [Clostridiales bacterium]